MEKTQTAFPERDQSKPDEAQGIFHKFDIRRVDGSDQLAGTAAGISFSI